MDSGYINDVLDPVEAEIKTQQFFHRWLDEQVPVTDLVMRENIVHDFKQLERFDKFQRMSMWKDDDCIDAIIRALRKTLENYCELKKTSGPHRAKMILAESARRVYQKHKDEQIKKLKQGLKSV